MRGVYKNAAVVVAASGAKDSSEGLFITDRPRAKIFRLPYRIDGEIQGRFNIMRLSGGWNLDGGPLERRAWTLQERYLARRFLAFMPHGITWICKEISMDEAGRHVDYFDSDIDWSSIFHRYTTRALTVPSDRPEAIKGIAEDMEILQKGRYVPEYGVWDGQLVRQLLWLSDGPQYDDGKLHKIPSWSWMATKDIKNWPVETHLRHFGTFLRPYEMPKRLMITPGGDLHLSGHLVTKPLATSYVQRSSAVPDLELQELSYLHDSFPHYRLVRDFHVITQDMHDTCHQAVLGIVRFDDISTASYTHICFLARQRRAHMEKSLATLQEQIIGDVVYSIERHSDFVYWVLLLEQVGESKFRRLGMGTLLPAAYEAFQVQVQEFEIM